MAGAMISLSISTTVASAWPDGAPDGIQTKGLAHGTSNGLHLLPLWVWLYCIFWWFVQDAAKVLTYKIMDRYDLFEYRTISEGNWKPTAQGGSATEDATEPLIKGGKGYGTVNH